MEEKILEILEEIESGILTYNGDNLYKDGILDSIQVVELVVAIEEKLGIEIDPEKVILENFANKKAIMSFVEGVINEQDAR